MALPLAMWWITNGSPISSLTVRRGLSELKGSWKIMRISRRSGLTCLLDSLATSMRSPAAVRYYTSPAVGA